MKLPPVKLVVTEGFKVERREKLSDGSTVVIGSMESPSARVLAYLDGEKVEPPLTREELVEARDLAARREEIMAASGGLTDEWSKLWGLDPKEVRKQVRRETGMDSRNTRRVLKFGRKTKR
jgi:hypothetical protein